LLQCRQAEQCLSILDGGGAGKRGNCMKRRWSLEPIYIIQYKQKKYLSYKIEWS
jgi:hypothetical protein